MRRVIHYDSPIGLWTLEGDDDVVTRIGLPGHTPSALTSGPLPATLRLLCEDLDAYFAGQRPNFRAPLAWQQGTDFQREVWRALTKIPYGQTRTYHDVSVMTGRPQAQRAVGQANNKNPWPLVVPCHRVVAANGLGGYAGHEDLKAWLLDFEQRT